MSRGHSSGRVVLAGVVLIALLSGLAAQDKKDDTKPRPKEVTAKGQVQVGVHSYKMEAGKLYFFRVEGQGFVPSVTLRPGYFSTSPKVQDDNFEAYFVPRETRNYRLLVLPNLNDDIEGGALDYKVTFKPIPLGDKPALQEKGELKAGDPVYKGEDGNTSQGPHRAYKIKLKARQLYIFDMVRTTKEMDPYLMLEGPGGKVVASDDDGGGNDASARIIFQPRRAGDYRIIATIADKERVGTFTLTVRTTED